MASRLRLLCMTALTACTTTTARFQLNGPVPSVDQPGFGSALFQTTGAKLTAGHRWDLVDNGKVFDALVEEIGHAKRSVHLLTYIWQPGQPSDRIIEALSKRDPAVRCLVLIDPVGSPDFESAVAARLGTVGCEARKFRPLTSGHVLPRNHRKIAVVDGQVGFLGGFGIRKDWVRGSGSADPEWRDINLRIRGPVVHDLQRAFAQNWQEAGGRLLAETEFPELAADGPATAGLVTSSGAPLTNAERLTHFIITAAKTRLWIWNAYFVPNDELLQLLVRKRREGVDVRLLVPGDKNDVPLYKLRQRETYPTLLRAGIRVFEYQPTMMHAKTMIIDERLAVVGSINLENLSLTELEEDAVVIEDPTLVTTLQASWAEDMKQVREILKP